MRIGNRARQLLNTKKWHLQCRILHPVETPTKAKVITMFDALSATSFVCVLNQSEIESDRILRTKVSITAEERGCF